MSLIASVVVGLIMVFTLALTAVAFRPAYVRMMDAVNSTVSTQIAGDSTALNSIWATVDTANGVYWAIPILGILLIALWVYMNANGASHRPAKLKHRATMRDTPNGRRLVVSNPQEPRASRSGNAENVREASNTQTREMVPKYACVAVSLTT